MDRRKNPTINRQIRQHLLWSQILENKEWQIDLSIILIQLGFISDFKAKHIGDGINRKTLKHRK